MNFTTDDAIRVVAVIRIPGLDATHGTIIEVPVMHARPGRVLPGGQVVARPCWPHEADMPLGTKVDLGFLY